MSNRFCTNTYLSNLIPAESISQMITKKQQVAHWTKWDILKSEIVFSCFIYLTFQWSLLLGNNNNPFVIYPFFSPFISMAVAETCAMKSAHGYSEMFNSAARLIWAYHLNIKCHVTRGVASVCGGGNHRYPQ